MHRIYQIRLCISTHKTCTSYPTKPKSDQWQFRTFKKSPRHSARHINTVTKFHNLLRCSLCCFSLNSQAISDWQFPEKITFSGKVLSRKIFNFLRICILISVCLWFWPFFFFFFCVFFLLDGKEEGREAREAWEIRKWLLRSFPWFCPPRLVEFWVFNLIQSRYWPFCLCLVKLKEKKNAKLES